MASQLPESSTVFDAFSKGSSKLKIIGETPLQIDRNATI
jgi:hypothetical protein